MILCWVIYIFLSLTVKSNYAIGVCTLPFGAPQAGELWISAEKGDVTITNSSINGYHIGGNINFEMEFNCEENQGNTYLLRATQMQNIFGEITRFYLCLYIYKVDDVTFYYYVGTEIDQFINDYVYPKKNDLATLQESCNKETPTEDRSFIMMVKKGSFENGLLNTTCPVGLLAIFNNVTVSATSGVAMTTLGSCQSSYLDVCTNRTIMHLHSGCPSGPEPLSNSGRYNCLYYMTTGGNTYLGVWNQDSAVNDVNSFRFSCFAFMRIGETVYATESPRFCSNTTTAMSTPTGITYLFTSVSESCLDEEEKSSTSEPVDLAFLYGLLAIFILLLLVFLIILIICLCMKCRCTCKKKAKESISKSKQKPKKSVGFFKPKQPIKVPVFTFKSVSGFTPNIKPMQKIAPLYTDSVEDYISLTPPRERAQSGYSTKSFDSVIFRQTDINESLSRITDTSKSSSSSSLTSTAECESFEIGPDSRSSSRMNSSMH